MSNKLLIGTSEGKDFKLPADACTQTFALLARRGAGKTYLASVFSEELLDLGHHIVILDLVGVWWGLRSSRDGKHKGYPILIAGGEHADIPLEQTAGKMMAEFLARERVPTILDLSLLTETGMRKFIADFAAEFYHLNRQPVHLFCDEADEYCPQNLKGQQGESARCLGAMQNIVRRGRARGIGVTLITQRSAVISKSVLTQTECLIAMQMTAPQDIEAIDAWLKYHAAEDARDAILRTLPGFEQGEAWVYSPAWLRSLTRIKSRARRTFDSSATPAPGKIIAKPKTVADVDLSRLSEAMKSTIEHAKANDPRELKAEIAKLKKELASKPTAKAETKTVEKPVITDAQIAQVDKSLDRAEALVTKAIDRLAGIVNPVSEALHNGLLQPVRDLAASVRAIKAPVREPTKMVPKREFKRAVPSESGGNQSLGKGIKYKMMVALCQYPEGLTRKRMAALAGASEGGGGFGARLSELRTAGYVEDDGQTFRATPEGIAAVGDFNPLPTGEELIEYWRGRIGGGVKRSIFDALVMAYPKSLTREELGAAAGASESGGGFGARLSELRSLGLIEGSRELTAAAELFE